MFDDHRILSGTEYGVVRHVSSPYHYPGGYIDDEEGEYILICDNQKYFSLIDTTYQSPSDAGGGGTSYIKTDQLSQNFTNPASYVYPLDSNGIGYILQSVVKTGNSTAYIGPCDLLNIKQEKDTSLSYVNVTPHMVWYGFFGQYGNFFPGHRNIIGDYQDPKLASVGIPLLNTEAYSASNYFYADAKSNILPTLASYVNLNTIRRDSGTSPIYQKATFIDYSPSNSCKATNTNIYPSGYNSWSAPLEGTTADGLSKQSYTLCYPISLKGRSAELILNLIADPVNFISKYGNYARPLCRAFHVYSLESKYQFGFTPAFFIPGPFIGVLLTWTPMTFSFSWVPYAVPTDKNMFFSSGMYANTDFIFSDVIYINIGSLSAGLRYQFLRSTRGSLVVKYKPSTTYIYSDLDNASATPFKETDDLFYLTNGLNPEEYMFCDGVLFGKQHFKYSTFSKKSANSLLYGGAWEPGEQEIILKGITLTINDGLLSTSYTQKINSAGSPSWAFSDLSISSLSHGIGYINQIVQQFSDGGGLSDDMLSSRNYLSSCQSPYDTIFCSGTESVKSLKIPNMLLLGMTSTQGFLDSIYNAIVDKVNSTVTLKTTQTNTVNLNFTLNIYTIILVSDDPQTIYDAGVSYHHVSTDPGINGWYIKTLTGMNKPARSIAGPAFLTGGESFRHLLLKQEVSVSCKYEFNIDLGTAHNASAVFVDFPFGACTSTISSAKVSVDGKTVLVPLVIKELIITGNAPTYLTELMLNDGDGLTFPKIFQYQDYIFTHSAKNIIMLDSGGNELIKDQIACVQYNNAQHTYIDRFDRLITDSIGEYLINKYISTI